jgi:hypothetical protein
MSITRCSCCGRELADGSLKYVVELRTFADFDGYLEEYKGDIEEGINELLDAVENMDLETLESDVYQVQIFILCKPCRDRFTSDPFHTGAPAEVHEEHKGTLH